MLALGPGESINTVFISVMLIFLICFTITLERLMHRVHRYLGDAHSPGNQMIVKVGWAGRAGRWAGGRTNGRPGGRAAGQAGEQVASVAY